MTSRKTEKVEVALVGGTKNLTVTIKMTRPDGSGVSFSMTPRAAMSLADQLNALLDDPSEGEV